MLKSMVAALMLSATALPALAAAPFTPVPAQTPTNSTEAGAAPAAEASPAREAVRKACSADFQKVCPDNKPGTPEASQCIRDNFDKLSEPCQGAIMTMMSSGGGGQG